MALQNARLPELPKGDAINPQDLFLYYEVSSGITKYIVASDFLTNTGDTSSYQWVSTATYNINDIVVYNNLWWISLINGNTGNIPTEGVKWTQINKITGSSIQNWGAGIYSQALEIVHYNGALYRLVSPTRPYNSANISAEILSGDWRALPFDSSGGYSNATGAEYGHKFAANITGQTGNSTYTHYEVDINNTGRTSTGKVRFIDFKTNGSTVFHVEQKNGSVHVDIGNPGLEADAINVLGTQYTTALRVNDIGNVNPAEFIVHRHSTTLSPIILGARSNSNDSTHAKINAGQVVLSMMGAGYLDSFYGLFGSVDIMSSSGVISNTSSPGKISFKATKENEILPTEAAYIDKNHVLKYSADVSPSFDDLSLINRGFSNSNYWKLSGTSVLTGAVNIEAGLNSVSIGKSVGQFSGGDIGLYIDPVINAMWFYNQIGGGSLGLYSDTWGLGDSTFNHVMEYSVATPGLLNFQNFDNWTIWSNGASSLISFNVFDHFYFLGGSGFHMKKGGSSSLNTSAPMLYVTTSFVQIGFGNNPGQFLEFTSTDIKVKNNLGAGCKGIQYESDFSSNYTIRSLIDLGFADATYLKKYAPNKTVTTNYVLTSADHGYVIYMNNAAALTLTINTGLPVGFECHIVKQGAGNVVIAAGVGVTLQSAGTTIGTQYEAASIYHKGGEIYNAWGNLT